MNHEIVDHLTANYIALDKERDLIAQKLIILIWLQAGYMIWASQQLADDKNQRAYLKARARQLLEASRNETEHALSRGIKVQYLSARYSSLNGEVSVWDARNENNLLILSEEEFILGAVLGMTWMWEGWATSSMR